VGTEQAKFEGGSILQATKKETTAAMFTLLQSLDGPTIGAALSILVCVLLGVHFVTTADAGTQVLCTLCALGSTNPPNWIRVLWCLLEGAIAAGLLLAGGLKAIQMASIVAGLPIAMLLLVMSYTLIHSLRKEMPSTPAWTPAAVPQHEAERRDRQPESLAAA
jgi:choline-glycine betaine transporter